MASITTLRGRPNGSLMSLARTLATTSVDVARRHGYQRRRRTREHRVGDRRRRRAASASVHGAVLLEGSLANCTSGPLVGEPAPALPLGEQLGDQATQLIACERHAARAEEIVDDLADGIGDLRRRAAVAEGRRHARPSSHPRRRARSPASGVRDRHRRAAGRSPRADARGHRRAAVRARNSGRPGPHRAALRRPWRSSDNPIYQ